MVPLVVQGLPDLTESVSEGVAQLEELLSNGPVGLDEGVSGVLATVREQMPEAGQLASAGLAAATTAMETVAGILLVLVLLFFYLKDGERIVGWLIARTPRHVPPRARGVADRAWGTFGGYFRGQLLVALANAVLIGLGLLVLGVPMALPLAVLIFFNGLFPIVGAVVTGILAVLVALADGGLLVGVAALAIVIGVQQLEGNVLSPLILGRSTNLHPVAVLVSITAGAVLLGVLGAFLAVPFVAILARTVAYLRGHGDEEDDEERSRARRKRGGDRAPAARRGEQHA